MDLNKNKKSVYSFEVNIFLLFKSFYFSKKKVLKL